eukprot:5988012-Prymnesium_polylepis.1
MIGWADLDADGQIDFEEYTRIIRVGWCDAKILTQAVHRSGQGENRYLHVYTAPAHSTPTGRRSDDQAATVSRVAEAVAAREPVIHL